MEMHKSALVSSTGLSSLLENCPQMQTQFACIMRTILPPNAKAKVKCKNLNLYHCFFCFFLQSKLIKKKSTARPVLGAGFFHQLRKNTKSRTKISVYLADFLCFPVVLCVCVCVLTTLITLPSITGERMPRWRCKDLHRLHPQVARTIDVINTAAIYIVQTFQPGK